MNYCAGAIFSRPPNVIRPFGARVSAHRLSAQASDWFAALPADGEMYGNDKWGDCWPIARRWVIALTRAAAVGEALRPAQQPILSDYTFLAGFNQLTGANDNGTDTSKGMADWCQSGVRVNDQTLDIRRWLTVDPTADAQLAIALWAAGPLMATWALPMAMQDPSNWSVAPGASTDWTTPWAEHETVWGKSDGNAEFFTRTWGQDLWVHPDVRRKFCIHTDVPLNLAAGQWIGPHGLTPDMIDRDALNADIAMLGAA
jgi:hypothetical protein